MTKAELTLMTNGCYGSNRTHVFGATRYSPTFLSQDVNIHYIVIANNAPSNDDWLMSRFKVLEIVKWSGDGSAREWEIVTSGFENDVLRKMTLE